MRLLHRVLEMIRKITTTIDDDVLTAGDLGNILGLLAKCQKEANTIMEKGIIAISIE